MTLAPNDTYGPMAGQWRDAVFVERRSEVAGA